MQDRGLGEQGRHHRRQFGPGLELAEVQLAQVGEALGRAVRRFRRGGVAHIDDQVLVLAQAGQDRSAQAFRRLPIERLGGRPDRPQIGAGDALAAQGDLTRRLAAPQRVAARDRIGEVEDVADLNPFGLQNRRQFAVEHGQVEIGLTAQNLHGLAAVQQVDDLAVADNVQPVDRRGFRGRIPGHGGRAHIGQALGRQKPHRRLCKSLIGVIAKAPLIVLQQQLGRSSGLSRGLSGNGHGPDPGRIRSVIGTLGGEHRPAQTQCRRHNGGQSHALAHAPHAPSRQNLLSR